MANLTCVSGHNQFTNPKLTRPIILNSINCEGSIWHWEGLPPDAPAHLRVAVCPGLGEEVAISILGHVVEVTVRRRGRVRVVWATRETGGPTEFYTGK